MQIRQIDHGMRAGASSSGYADQPFCPSDRQLEALCPRLCSVPAVDLVPRSGGDHEVDRDAARARSPRHCSAFELVLAPNRSLGAFEAARNTEGALDSTDDRDHLVREILARCDALMAVHLTEIDEAFGRPTAFADDRARSVERRMLVPWLLATGETMRARQYAGFERGELAADRSRRSGRQSDLLAQQFRVAMGRRPSHARSHPDANACADLVLGYQKHIECYWHLMDGDVLAARRSLRRLDGSDGSDPQIPPAGRGLHLALSALCDALDGACGVGLRPPTAQLTLYGVDPVLAAAEAVALGGTRENAADWCQWFDREWPAQVVRGPGWPVLVQRIRALLSCRVGDLEAGLSWMSEAIAVADRIQSPVEAALARVQYADLLALDPRSGNRDRWSAATDAGTAQCRALGLPAEHHAHRAGRAATLGRFDVMAMRSPAAGDEDAGLTPREIEVLRLFTAGHSYRQAAAVLGVGWRTVQSHAYNAYQKLGVSSKIAAVSAAGRMRLL